jgi:hypothetical protein
VSFLSLFDPPAQEREQPPLVSGPSIDEVLVRVHWLTPEEMANEYPGQAANVATFTGDDSKPHAVIRAVQPKDFNDIPRLVSLGHELFHAFGATHA